MITPDQIRAARALINWSQHDLAERTGLAVPTIANIELGKQKPSTQTISKIILACESAGVEFIGNRGVEKSRLDVHHYYDISGFKTFLDDLYEVSKNEGGELCLHNARTGAWLECLGENWFEYHAIRMAEIKDSFNFRIISAEGNLDFIGARYARYRWIPKNLFDENSAFYVYGGNVAFINFRQKENVVITAIHRPQVASSMRTLFDLAWNNLTIDTPEH